MKYQNRFSMSRAVQRRDLGGVITALRALSDAKKDRMKIDL